MLKDQSATKKVHRSKKLGNPRTDAGKMPQPDLVELFSEAFVREYDPSQPGESATEKWESLRVNMHLTALVTFWKKTLKSCDWFEAKSTELTPVIESKRAAFFEYKPSPSGKNLKNLGLPGARSSKPPGVAQMHTEQSSAKPLIQLLQQATSE